MRRCIRRVRGSIVLIIADDPIARDVYCELFAMRGHQVEAAAGARAGLARVAHRRDVAVVVLALRSIGAVAPLRRRLRALAPRLRVHALGVTSGGYDALMPSRQQLLH
jgi:CheY-like chemotaxis protein